MSTGVMTPQHPRWQEFVERLTGPEGCNFHHDGTGWLATCEGGSNRPGAVVVLRAMGLSDQDVLASLDFFDRHGGHCDCEILMNVDRPDDLFDLA